MDFITPKVDWTPSIASGEFPDEVALNRMENNTVYNYDTVSLSGGMTYAMVLQNRELQEITVTLEDGERLKLKKIAYYITGGSPSENSGYQLTSNSSVVWTQTERPTTLGGVVFEAIDVNLTVFENTTGTPKTQDVTVAFQSTSGSSYTFGLGDAWNFVFLKESI